MKKIIFSIMAIILSISNAAAFDFSSIDPRLSSDRNGSSNTETSEDSAEKSKVFRSPQSMTQAVEKKAAPSLSPIKSSTVKIVAVVNGDIISSEDLDDRVKAFIMSSQIPVNDENKAVIYQRVLSSTIDEKLKVQEAEKNGINITEADIDASIANFEVGNKIGKGKMKNVLKEYGVSEKAFREQMKADLAWIRLIRQRVEREGGISNKDVQQELANAEKDFSTSKYQLSEIFISGKNKARVNEISEALKNDPRFEYYAFQFSESPTASAGGQLGWINIDSLSEPLQKAVKKLKAGEISEPIKVGEDYYIMKLGQVYNPSSNKHMPTEKEIRQFFENPQLDTTATKYIQQLRQKAVIEFRG